MPDEPLPSGVVTRLKCDPVAALAAAVLIVGSFPNIVLWALTAFGGHPGAPTGEVKVKANGTGVATGGDGAKKRAPVRQSLTGNGEPPPRQAAAKHDEALLKLMRANPAANVTELIRLNGRPRNSTVLSLERLEKAGLVEHARRGQWTVVDPDLLAAATPKASTNAQPAGWLEPLSGKHVARHAADGRVRGELTLAAQTG